MIQDTKSEGKEFAKLYLFEDNAVRHTDIKSLKDKSIDGIVLSLKNILHLSLYMIRIELRECSSGKYIFPKLNFSLPLDFLSYRRILFLCKKGRAI
mgnify:CR=1 FL=1